MAAVHQRLLQTETEATESSHVSSGQGRWDATPDLERWLSSFYHYFELKGYRGLLAVNLLHLAAAFFTIVFSFTAFFFVNWEALGSCHSEESCLQVSLWYDKPFDQIGFKRFLVLLCTICFIVYWLTVLKNTYTTCRDAADMNDYFKDRLGIKSDDMLATMLWSEVVSRLVHQQRSVPFCVVQDHLTALEITNIIMREENYVIALTNHDAFTKRLHPWIPPRIVYTKCVLGVLRHAIFRSAFDERGRLRDDFLDDPGKLARRLRWLGAALVFLNVPVLIFVSLVFFMRHAEEFRSHRTSPFRREWTDYAKWTFREFNELPHHFKERMRAAQVVAEEYAGSTRRESPVCESVQRFVKFVAGSILAVLLIVTFWDDTPMLFVKVLSKNLLWYLALFGFIFAVADNAQDRGDQQTSLAGSLNIASTPLLMYNAMMKLVRCTHYYPQDWRAPAPLATLAGACNGAQRAELCKHFEDIRGRFVGSFFVHRIQALAEELIGVLASPFLLIIWLPESAPDIVDVIRQSRHSTPNLGDWCSFGCLDPSLHGSELYGGPSCRGGPGASSSAGDRVGYEGIPFDREISSNGGKLEKSVLSFMLSHRLSTNANEGMEADTPWWPQRSATPRAAQCLRSLQGPRTFKRAGAAGNSAPPPIQMRELGSGCQQAEEQDVEGAAAPPAAPCADLWGYPACSLRLLQDLEDFQQKEMGTCSPEHRLYALLPEELTSLELVAPSLGMSPLPPSVGPGSCSSHFFWLEVLYDFHSGRHASHLGDAGGGATFELLDRESESRT